MLIITCSPLVDSPNPFYFMACDEYVSKFLVLMQCIAIGFSMEHFQPAVNSSTESPLRVWLLFVLVY